MDIRWQQRFLNFEKAMAKLNHSVNYIQSNIFVDVETLTYKDLSFEITELIQEGLIQRFENTHELAWNVMKDYAEYQGNSNIGGSRDATREAFKLQIISNGEIWMDMIGSRNKTSYTYNEETANEIFGKILNHYYSAFLDFQKTMDDKRKAKQ